MIANFSHLPGFWKSKDAYVEQQISKNSFAGPI